MKQLPLVLFSIAACAVSSHAGVIVSYPDFSDTTGLTLVGGTATASTGDGTVLRLTPAAVGRNGAAYSTSAVTLGAADTFSTSFQFRFTGAGGIDPADGITFVLAANPTGLGVGGAGLGYQGVANSVAVEFDTFHNGGVDADSNHVAVDTGGALTDTALSSPYGVPVCDFSAGAPHTAFGCLSNGDLWTATIGYDGSLLNVVVQDGAAAPFVAIAALPIDLAAAIGSSTAFVGFTGGTGSGFENQDIVNWRFADTTELASAPEPGSMLLLLAGALAALPALRRRR